MNSQQFSNLLEEAKAELQRIEREATAAQRRLEIAKVEADNLEDRNRRALQMIEQEVETHRKEIIAEAEKTAKQLTTENEKLAKTKTALSDGITEFVAKQGVLQTTNDILLKERNTLQAQINQANNDLQAVTEEVETKKRESDTLNKQITNLNEQISQLQTHRQDINKDIEALGTEADNLENSIIELDATFQARKETYDAQLREIQLKLQNTVDSLTEAQNKDNEIRQQWAIEHEKLDKRMEVLQKKEYRLRDADARVAELDRFSKL